MTSVLCPGSFDPPTNGHIDVIDRCIATFDRVVVAIVENPSKQPAFTVDERKAFVAASCPDAEVIAFRGLVVEAARAAGADLIVKGLRGEADFAYELQMAQMNRSFGGVDTMFMAASPEFSYLSSSLVKEVAALGGDVSRLVPADVARALKERHG